MQDLNQINLKEAIGKTIAKVAVTHDRHAIAYTDGSFSYFGRFDDWGSPSREDANLNYETFIERLNIRSDGSTYFTSTQEMLIAIGALDGAKLIEDAKERIAGYVANSEKLERKRYEELKAKFEPKNLGKPTT